MGCGGNQAGQESGPGGAQGLLEVACQALSGNMAEAASALCAAACGATGARAAVLEQRVPSGRLRLGVAGEPPAADAPAERVRVPLAGGALVLFAPQAAQSLPESVRALAAALLRRAADEAAARTWRQSALYEARARRQSVVHQQQERRQQGHDLRAPLVIIKGYTDMMLRQMAGPLRPEALRYLERVSEAIDSQRRLLDQAFPPAPRAVPSVGTGAAVPLPRFLGALAQLARRREASVELRGGAQGPALPGWLAQAWLRALGSAAAPGAKLEVCVQPASLGPQVSSRAPLAGERSRRRWLALQAEAQRRNVPLEVTLDAQVQARWEGTEGEALPLLRARG